MGLESFGLIGPYRVIRLLGKGGMGAVYEAINDQTSQRAAIKLLLPHLSEQAEVVSRFFNEAHAMRACANSGIVEVYDVGQLPNGVAYMVMEYIEGESLAARLKRGPLSHVAYRYARDVAAILAAAHARGIVHRDLKPDNVMLVGDQVKLLDFGIAKIAEGAQLSSGMRALRTKTGMVMGTPGYMSPEQCLGERGVDGRTDVYALGSMLYELLAGRPPFYGKPFGEILMMQIYEPPPPLRSLVPSLPPAVEALVERMLQKPKEARPTMQEVADALVRMEATGDAATLMGSAATLLSPPRQSGHGRLAAAFLVGLAVAGGAGAVAWWQLRPPPPVVVVAPAPPAPPPAPPAPPPPPAPAVEKKAEKVQWLVKSQPAGADVVSVQDGSVVAKTPWYTDHARGTGAVEFELRLAGYQPQRFSLTVEQDAVVKLSLKAKPKFPKREDVAEDTKVVPLD